MENLLTRKNLIIAGVVFLLVVVAVIYFAGGREEAGEPSASGFGGLFPSFGENGGAGGTGATGITNGGAGASRSQFENVPISEIVSELPLGSSASANLPKGSLILLSTSQISSLLTVASTTIYSKNVPENLGHIFARAVDGTGEETRISNLTIPRVIKMVWAPDGKKAVAFYRMEGEVRKLLITLVNGSPETEFLPNSISDVAFSPDSARMAFINNLEEGETNNIFIATAAFNNPRKLLDNDVPTFEISWPLQDSIALKTKSSYALPGYLYTVSVNTGNMEKIAEGRGLDAVWSEDGKIVLYSSSDQNGSLRNLKAYNTDSDETIEFNIKTIAEKCAVGNSKAYCGVPKALAFAKYPDEWWQGKVSMEDHAVELGLVSGEVSVVVSTFSEIILPRLTPSSQFLLFKDKKTGYLWSLKLK